MIIRDNLKNLSLKFVAGYVAHRYRSKYPNLGTPTKDLPSDFTPDWITHISKGNLMYPSEDLLNNARVLEVVFNEFHGNSLSNEDLIFQKVAAKVCQRVESKCIIAWDALLCLVRTRTYIRLRLLNKQRADAKERVRIARKSAKKLKFMT